MTSFSPRDTPFNPRDWYWQIEGETERVYSTLSGDFISTSEQQYTDWLARVGNEAGGPTPVRDEATLGDTLARFNLRPPDTATDAIEAYKESHANKLTMEIVAKILFWLVNEVRTLKGQNPVTAQQFKAFIKDRM